MNYDKCQKFDQNCFNYIDVELVVVEKYENVHHTKITRYTVTISNILVIVYMYS